MAKYTVQCGKFTLKEIIKATKAVYRTVPFVAAWKMTVHWLPVLPAEFDRIDALLCR